MRARRSRAVSLLVTSVVLTGLLIPGAVAQPPDAGPAAGPGTAASAEERAEADAVDADVGAAGAVGAGGGADSGGSDAVDAGDIAAEPPAQPARPPARDLFGADCDLEITGSYVAAYCHNRYAETDLVRLHVECDRWWDVDGDGAPAAVGPAGRVELAGRCWKEVRSAWVSHERP